MFVACEKNMAKTSMYQDKKNLALRSNALQELGNITYDKDGPSKTGATMWVMNRL
jgi:hypothetical protein